MKFDVRFTMAGFKKSIISLKLSNCLIKTTLIAMSAIATSSVAHAKNVAVLVGINDYMYNGETKTVIEDLRGAKNDAESLREALIADWNFAPEDITLLTDKQATHTNIMRALHDLETKSSAGDEVLIFFSGHGTSIYDKNSHLYNKNVFLSKNSGAFLPTDYNDAQVKKLIDDNQLDKAIKEQLITGQYHLRPLISRLDKDRKVTAIIDACYSENSFRTPIPKNGEFASKSPSGLSISAPQKIAYVTNTSDDGKYSYKNTITLSASAKNQVATDIQNGTGITIDNKPHGLMTDMLLRAMNNPSIASGDDGILSYADLRKFMGSKIITYPLKVNQTPIFQPAQRNIIRTNPKNTNILDRPLFGIAYTGSRNMEKIEPVKIKVTSGQQTLSEQVDSKIFTVVTGGLADFELGKQSSEWLLSAGNGQTIARTNNFENIRNRIEAEYWLNKVKVITKDTTKSDFATTPEDNGNSFDAGDKFQFLAQFDKSSAVLMFNINSKGRINILYPFYPHENIVHQENSILTVPKNEQLTVAPPYGLEKMVMVTLRSPLSEIERNQLSALMDINEYSMQSQPIHQLTQVLKQSATSVSTINLQTFAK